MTENEAIELLNKVMFPPEFAITEQGSKMKVVWDMAIQALEEIQQYRAIDTVEDIRKIYSLCKILQNTVKDYSAIGTVEECRVAVELVKKLNDRKMTPEAIENYMQFEDECVKEGYTFKSILEARERMKPKKVESFDYKNGTVNYGCPVCKRKIISKINGEWCGGSFQEKCDRCGQTLDWSNERSRHE